jgi:hypothetical protein
MADETGGQRRIPFPCIILCLDAVRLLHLLDRSKGNVNAQDRFLVPDTQGELL